MQAQGETHKMKQTKVKTARESKDTLDIQVESPAYKLVKEPLTAPSIIKKKTE